MSGSENEIEQPRRAKLPKHEQFVPLYTSEEWGELVRVVRGNMRPLKGFEGRYSVSDQGYIFNGHGVRLRPHRRITRNGIKQGPVTVYLWDGSRSIRVDLARTVFGTFRCEGGEMPTFQGLVFLDNDTENCALSNLRCLSVEDTPIKPT